MSVKDPSVLTDDKLNDTDREILELLHEGRVSPPYVSDVLDKSREYSSERLIRLNEHGHVNRIAPGLYQLVDDPRDDVEPTPDADTLQARIDELESDLTDAREDIEYYKDKLRSCREQLEEMPDRQELARTIEDLETACERGDSNGVEVALERLKEAAGVDDGS